MTSDLAIRTLRKALSSQRKRSNGLILHSDQGSPYTSKAFTDFCEEHDLTQSMSKAGCPYDNAPMERYFNTLKNEEIYLHEYHDEESLYVRRLIERITVDDDHFMVEFKSGLETVVEV